MEDLPRCGACRGGAENRRALQVAAEVSERGVLDVGCCQYKLSLLTTSQELAEPSIQCV